MLSSNVRNQLRAVSRNHVFCLINNPAVNPSIPNTTVYNGFSSHFYGYHRAHYKWKASYSQMQHLSTIPENPKSPIDIEKELFAIKRRMTQFHSRGEYELALECAIELEQEVEKLMGTKNAVYASSVNNVALMVSLHVVQ